MREMLYLSEGTVFFEDVGNASIAPERILWDINSDGPLPPEIDLKDLQSVTRDGDTLSHVDATRDERAKIAQAHAEEQDRQLAAEKDARAVALRDAMGVTVNDSGTVVVKADAQPGPSPVVIASP